jgi:uracil-DNA glycosylase family 4
VPEAEEVLKMFGSLTHFTRQARFRALVNAVHHCTLCPRMSGRAKVLSESSGNIHSKVLFIGEAPGRLGADRTGVPFRGDRSGDNFEILLRNIGWTRADIFITNAVLCNPRGDEGNNEPPSDEELANCSAFLQMTMELIDPDVVVTLGAVALRAIARIHPHNYRLRQTVSSLVPWSGRSLMPMYHPSQRAAVHRSIASQRADYFQLCKLVDPHTGLRRRRPARFPRVLVTDPHDLSKMAHVIVFLLYRLGRVSKFKLTKLLYLADFAAGRGLGRDITQSVYLRQVEGPWPPAIDRALNQLAGYEVITSLRRGIPIISLGPSPRFEPQLDDDEAAILLEVLNRYGDMTNSQIKSAAYRTAPMRELLKRERAGERTLNAPVLHTRRD